MRSVVKPQAAPLWGRAYRLHTTAVSYQMYCHAIKVMSKGSLFLLNNVTQILM